MMQNSINLGCRITQPIKYKATKNGTPMATLSIANNRRNHCNFFDCVAFGKTADYLHKYLKKGQKMAITGVMNHNIVNGESYYSINIINVDADRERSSIDNGTQSTTERVNNALKYIPNNYKKIK